MEPPDRLRPLSPRPGAPTLEDVQRAIDGLDREDRAALRPWLLARYDVRGYRAAGYVDPQEPAR